jgi:hypothetical protein
VPNSPNDEDCRHAWKAGRSLWSLQSTDVATDRGEVVICRIKLFTLAQPESWALQSLVNKIQYFTACFLLSILNASRQLLIYSGSALKATLIGLYIDRPMGEVL